MLSYAFHVLNEQGYKDVATERFQNVAELCAAILAKGVAIQLKRGLEREYLEQTEPLSSPRGRIEITETLRTMEPFRKRLTCVYDDFSVNSRMNQIVKSTMTLLLRSDVSQPRKKELKRTLAFLDDVDSLDVRLIDWNVRYCRNNQSYRMLIAICYLVVKGLLQTQTDGTTRLMDFLDEQRMHRLYEKFILEYFRKEHPELTVGAPQIPWVVDDGVKTMLPVMQSDVMLSHKDNYLVIDAKYYSRTLQVQYDRHTLHSSNLYQIFTYVKNKEASLAGRPHVVSGILLYAKTNEEHYPEHEYQMSGNRIVVQTLNLDADFHTIAQQLDKIVSSFFPNAITKGNSHEQRL